MFVENKSKMDNVHHCYTHVKNCANDLTYCNFYQEIHQKNIKTKICCIQNDSNIILSHIAIIERRYLYLIFTI